MQVTDKFNNYRARTWEKDWRQYGLPLLPSRQRTLSGPLTGRNAAKRQRCDPLQICTLQIGRQALVGMERLLCHA